MPEIGEVARIVHYLRKHLVNRTVKSCEAFSDDIVYGKVGCSAEAFTKAVEGKKVVGAGQQGKYFYLTFDSPPHSVMHLGMTGWIKFSAEETGYYKQAVEDNKKPEEWPPKYMKWLMKCEADGDREAVEVAFVDARRLARIRLVECEAQHIRRESPLKENGPDPVIDGFTVEWLSQRLNRKKVPVKALLLDQANISGVGNWVADEVLYNAKLHPEQYSNTLDQDQIKRLHDSLIYVCTTACELLADSSKFPETWLMKYRWDKGKKGEKNVLPNGEKIVHLTVGGRTSAIVPSVQKKTGPVAGDIKQDENEEDAVQKKTPAKDRKRKSKADQGEEDDEEEVMPTSKKRGTKTTVEATNGTPKTGRGKKTKTEPADEEDEHTLPIKKRKTTPAKSKKEEKPATPGERKSTRVRAK